MQQKGLIVGLLIGLSDATGGAYKDHSIVGFYLKKFFKSSTLGPLCGFIISFKTSNPLFHLLGTIALMRMSIELLFKILSKHYIPGKFNSMTPIYPEWSMKRKVFLFSYIPTWSIFILLFII